MRSVSGSAGFFSVTSAPDSEAVSLVSPITSRASSSRSTSQGVRVRGAREAQEVLGDAPGPLDRAIDGVQRRPQRGGELLGKRRGLARARAKQPGGLADDGQRVVDLVRDARREFAEGGQPVRDDHVPLELATEDAVLAGRAPLAAMVRVAQLRHERLDVDRLGQVVEEAEAHPVERRVEIGVSGEHHHLDPGPAILDPAQRLDAVHARHAHVQHDHVDLPPLQALQRLGSALRREDLQPTQPQPLREHLEEVALVVDEQDPHRMARSSRPQARRAAVTPRPPSHRHLPPRRCARESSPT